jgi:hypothetical protein
MSIQNTPPKVTNDPLSPEEEKKMNTNPEKEVKSIFLNGSSVGMDTNYASGKTNLTEQSLLKKAKGEARKFKNELSSSLKEIQDGAISSLKNMVNGQDKRDLGNHFHMQSGSIANLHKDAIEGILNNVSDGNLFDAGVAAISLFNTGTKFSFAMDLDVDKDSYSFKYLKYFGSGSKEIDFDVAESDRPEYVRAFIEGIEDPTLLGYGFKLDLDGSPLLNETENGNIQKFLKAYSPYHPELHYAQTYLNEFRNDIQKVFDLPSTYGNIHYKQRLFKNHYIASVAGLDKLDLPFVEYGSEDEPNSEQLLTITMNEDVRMFTSRLVFLYRNLTYSYRMGKKLIPENLLRFNLYVKISDIRNFTGGQTNKLNESIRDKYSRMVYELKECEFIFDESVNPETIFMGGFDNSTGTVASLTFKIKYRKVNRFFYSTFFSNDLGEMVISDKFLKPDTKAAADYLRNKKMIPSDIAYSDSSPDQIGRKRKAVSNNHEVVPSLKDRFNKLKNGGLLRDNDNDSAVGRFVKKTTNNAVKAAMQPVDDGLKKVKNTLNNVNILGKKNPIKSLLSLGVTTKLNLREGALGDLHPTGTGKVDDPLKVIEYPYIENVVDTPVRDVHPDLNGEVVTPRGDLHDDMNAMVNKPIGDLHDTVDSVVSKPEGDLHDTVDSVVSKPEGDVHPDVTPNGNQTLGTIHTSPQTAIITPAGDLHDTVDNSVVSPLGDLHDTVVRDVVTPSDTVHTAVAMEVSSPTMDLHPNVEHMTANPDAQVAQVTESPVQTPNAVIHTHVEVSTEMVAGDVHQVAESEVNEPIGNVNTNKGNEIGSPDANINQAGKATIENPTGDLHPDANHKVEKSDKYSDIKEFLKRKK